MPGFVRIGAQTKIVADTDIGKYLPAFRYLGNTSLYYLVWLHILNMLALEDNFPRDRLQHPHHSVHQSRFTGPV